MITPTPPQLYRARVGRRRSYLSQSDAHAYSAGYAAYPGGDIPPDGTPAYHGWMDACSEAMDKADRVFEARQA